MFVIRTPVPAAFSPNKDDVNPTLLSVLWRVSAQHHFLSACFQVWDNRSSTHPIGPPRVKCRALANGTGRKNSSSQHWTHRLRDKIALREKSASPNSCMQAMVLSTFWWLICMPVRQTGSLSGECTGPLTMKAVHQKICKHKQRNYQTWNVLQTKITRLESATFQSSKAGNYNIAKPDTNLIQMLARTESRLAATEGKNVSDGTRKLPLCSIWHWSRTNE